MKSFRNLSGLPFVMISILVLMLASCGDKDKDDPKDQRSPRLKKMVIRDISLEPPMEESDSVRFLYDNNNRLIAMAGYGTGDSISFQYNADGRIVKTGFFTADLDNFIIQYVWSGNTVTMTQPDSPNGKAIFELNSDSKITRLDSYALVNQQWILQYYMLYNWQGGNLVSAEAWSAIGKSTTFPAKYPRSVFSIPALLKVNPDSDFTRLLKQDFVKESEQLYTYDNKINPFKDVQIYQFSEVGYFDSENNVTTVVSNAYNLSGVIEDSYTDNYSFIYNPENFPLSKTLSYSSWTSSENYQYE